MVHPLELAWVCRARDMLNDDVHIARRNALNRFADWHGLEPAELAWPGYLGADYAAGEGVLVIANVHRQFCSDGLSGDPGRIVARMTAATSQLRYGAGAVLDDYLLAVRAVYELGLGPKGWRVAKHMGRVYQASRLDDTNLVNRQRMAFINTSCGQYPEQTGDDGVKAAGRTIKQAMYDCCDQAHPVSALADVLKPALIICMSITAYKTLEHAGWTDRATVVSINQRMPHLKLLRPVELAGKRFEKNSRPEQWLPALTRHVEERTALS